MNDMSFTMNATQPAAFSVAPAAGGPVVISLHSALEPLEAEWRQLESASSVSLHNSYDWCSAWVRAHGSQVAVVKGTVDGQTVFLLPLEIVKGRLFSTARFIGTPHSNINTGLFAAGFGDPARPEVVTAIREELRRLLAPMADAVALEKMPLDWRGARHPLASLPSVRNQNASYQLPLLASFEETLAQINAKRRRKKFRTSERRLEAFGGYEHVIARSQEERRGILDLFFRQKAVRFDALGLPNVFRDEETQAFFHALAALDQKAPDFPLELNAIRLKGEHDGRIIAIAGLSRKGDHVICQFGSIDEEIAADTSPGELLFYLMIRRCCAEGASIFDFGIGDQLYKRSWCTVETAQSDILIPLTLRGHLAAHAHRGLVGLKSAIKKNQRAYALLQRLRRQRQAAPAEAGDHQE